MEELFRITNLTKLPVFNDLSLTIHKNTLTVLSGSNNCGKTTLLRTLNKEEMNQKDTVFYLKKDILDYSDEEYDKEIQAIFPKIMYFRENTVIDQLYVIQDKIDHDKVNFLLDNLNLTKIQNKEIEKIDIKDKIKVSIASAILKARSVIIIDNLEEYYNSKELNELYSFFHQCIKKYNLSFIVSCINLDNALYGDELIILKEGKVILQGIPLEVLSKDNIINKAGLQIPFMIDLSVKLKDYDLLKTIELESEKLVDTLWK